jgi:RNA-directed DNA polymerase
VTQAQKRNMGTCRSDGKQEAEGERISNCESSDAEHRDGLTSSSCEGAVMVLEPRGQLGQPEGERAMEKDQRTHHKKAKPFIITKREMYAAWLKVKRNQGAGGSDQESLDDFERRLEQNLYKLWNRMSSGTYFPKPVLRVEMRCKSTVRKNGWCSISSAGSRLPSNFQAVRR